MPKIIDKMPNFHKIRKKIKIVENLFRITYFTLLQIYLALNVKGLTKTDKKAQVKSTHNIESASKHETQDHVCLYLIVHFSHIKVCTPNRKRNNTLKYTRVIN
jgi:hypothetical protein